MSQRPGDLRPARGRPAAGPGARRPPRSTLEFEPRPSLDRAGGPAQLRGRSSPPACAGLKHAIRGDSSFFAHAYRGTPDRA